MGDPPDADPRTQQVSGPQLTLTWGIRQAVEELHLALLGILIGIGLAVGFGIRAPWYIAVASGITTTVLVAIGFRWKTTPRSATCLTSASIKTAKPTAIKVPRHQLVEIDVANGAQTHPVRAVRYKEHNRPRQRGRATGGPD